ncbi:MAG TPA: hypothetical protein VFG69_01515 [Nannocystaceae bacterium]|nr:hypothetical protein [Nannocystaceae bacterium]
MTRLATALLVISLGCGPDTASSDGGGTGSASDDGSSAPSTSGDDDASSGADGSTSAADSTGGGVDVCACAGEQQDYPSCGFEITCELPMPCERLTVTCPRPGADLYDCTAELVYDTDALRCVLEVLRDDTPAHLRVDGDVDQGTFVGPEEHQLLVLGDRRLTKTTCMATDVGGDGSAATMSSADADYFTACLALDIPRERYECLWAGLAPTGDLPACE